MPVDIIWRDGDATVHILCDGCDKEYEILAVNRHLKVIGIFSRLYMRDKKKSYLKNLSYICLNFFLLN